MANKEFEINIKQIKEKSLSATKIRKLAQKVANEIVGEEVGYMVNNFEKHEISKEIRDGASETSRSGAVVGGGNLFGFIGFDENTDPVGEVAETIRDNTYVKKGVKPRGKDYYNFEVYIPIKEIKAASSMPHLRAQSWVMGIEKGISNISHFLGVLGRPSSRSGGGIQVKQKINSKSFLVQDYLTGIIEKFKKRIEKISKKSTF